MKERFKNIKHLSVRRRKTGGKENVNDKIINIIILAYFT